MVITCMSKHIYRTLHTPHTKKKLMVKVRMTTIDNTHLNDWSPADGTAQEELGGMSLGFLRF